MRSRAWLVIALTTALVVGVAAGCLVPSASAAKDPRPKTVTKGLDYFHAQQRDDGSLGTMAATEWGILGAVAGGERMGAGAWRVDGKNPFTFLQASSHEAAASAADVANPAVYYARAVMSYVAAGQSERVFTAGTPRVDLLAKLYAYQDLADGSPTKGSFSPSSSSRTFKAVHTTAWAILAMHAMGEDGKDRFRLAVAWLAGQQNGDGGFPDQESKESNCEDTGVAIQALWLGDSIPVDPSIIAAARAYLKSQQRADAGFPYKAGGATGSNATAAAIQAILALGERPTDDFWKVGVKTPTAALAALEMVNGAYPKKRGDARSLMQNTGWALVALRDRPFTSYPRNRGDALKAFVFRPRVEYTAPGNGASFSYGQTVTIRARYTDGAKGTGVKPNACRVYVDATDRTRSAVIASRSLRLQVQGIASGSHTYKLRIVDHAGNVKEVERHFAVSGGSTPVTPTTPLPYDPSDNVAPAHTTTPVPSDTEYPYTSTSPSPTDQTIRGAPIPSLSPSSSPSAGAGASGGGSAAGFVGGTLLAMLPIGAAVSYLAFHRREEALGAAGRGKRLGGGGSPSERLRRALGRVKDLVRPAGS